MCDSKLRSSGWKNFSAKRTRLMGATIIIITSIIFRVEDLACRLLRRAPAMVPTAREVRQTLYPTRLSNNSIRACLLPIVGRPLLRTDPDKRISPSTLGPRRSRPIRRMDPASRPSLQIMMWMTRTMTAKVLRHIRERSPSPIISPTPHILSLSWVSTGLPWGGREIVCRASTLTTLVCQTAPKARWALNDRREPRRPRRFLPTPRFTGYSSSSNVDLG